MPGSLPRTLSSCRSVFDSGRPMPRRGLPVRTVPEGQGRWNGNTGTPAVPYEAARMVYGSWLVASWLAV